MAYTPLVEFKELHYIGECRGTYYFNSIFDNNNELVLKYSREEIDKNKFLQMAFKYGAIQKKKGVVNHEMSRL